MKRMVIRTACLLLTTTFAAATEPFEVWPNGLIQQAPSVSGGVVVWQEYVQVDGAQDWDIFGVDLAGAPSERFTVASMDADQTRPAIWGPWVAWEDNFYGDADVWVSDIADRQNVQTYSITPYADDQSYPRVHGDTVVWQHQYVDQATQATDWDIYAAVITDPADPRIYSVAAFEANQQHPAVFRSRVVWQDDFWGDFDIESADIWRLNNPETATISAFQTQQTLPAVSDRYAVWQEDFGSGQIDLYAADLSDPNRPVEFLITDAPGAQQNPAISGHLIVWQDNRSGPWNLYGYNLITRQEFAITNDGYNQTRPAIDDRLVVYEDDRSGTTAIYALWLEGPQTLECPTPVAGDANGDCLVDLYDLAIVAANWLLDGGRW